MTFGPLLRSLRAHHWAKNALVLLPALAAHLPWTPALAARLALGFAAFSALASGLYLVNDFVDLPSDRLHARKSRRPLASGALGKATAAGAAAALVLAAAGLSLALPSGFRLSMAAYAALALAYSVSLKRHPVLDVIVLATLYTPGIVAGAALAEVALSRWFLAFAVFVFFSLALLKRVAELLEAPEDTRGFIGGRSYVRADAPALSAFGAASAAAGALVYCLYIASGDVGALYRRSDLLWAGLPILLYGSARVWLVAARGDLRQDPVAFALRDRVTWITLAAFLAIVMVAA